MGSVLATCSASFFFCFGQRELFGKQAGWRTILHLPFLMGLGVGICVNNTKAVIEAITSSFNGKQQSGEFVRTPKYGVTGDNQKWRGGARRVLTFKKLLMPMLEIAMGCYMVMCIFISILWNFGQLSIPFLLIFAGGYFYVGFASIHALVRMQRESDALLEPEPEITPT